MTARRAFGVVAVLLSMVPVATAQQPRWEEIGPDRVGGRVSAIAQFGPDDGHLLAGTPAGGLWKSLDSGTTWTGQTLWLASLPISTAAVDPTGTQIVLGTGAMDDNGALHGGVGLVISHDSGATWALRDGGLSGSFISSVVMWPGQAGRLVVGTDLGVRVSTDGGITFHPALDGQAISAIVPDATRPGVGFASGRSGLFQTQDAGDNWTRVSAWPLAITDEFGSGTTALAVSAVTPGLLYATVQTLSTFNNTGRALVLRSIDDGRSFTTLTPPADFCPGAHTCGFAHALFVDPLDDTRLLLGGERLLRSTDSGDTWQEVAGNLRGVHQILRGGSHTFVAGRFGVAELDDQWLSATRRNNGLAVTGITSLDVSTAGDTRVLAGTSDNGTLLGSGEAPVWQTVFGRDEPAGPGQLDPFNPSTIFASRLNGLLYRSLDGGQTFAPAQNGLDLQQSATSLAPLAASPLRADVWYTGRLQMFSSTDGASTWTAFRPAGFPEVGLIAPSPIVADRVYFATTQSGTLYKADGDTTDQLVVSTEPNVRLTSLFPDVQAQNVLYAAGLNTADQTGRVYKTADFGVTWTAIAPPNLAPVTGILKDPYGALYVSARDGVWRSGNDGFSWTPLVDGLFAGGVNVLKQSNGWLFAGTMGRGVFRMRELPLVSIESIPAGVRFDIDGTVVSGPYLAHWDAGTTHTITPVLQNTADTHEQFLGWTDSAQATRTVTASDINQSLLLGVERSFRLRGLSATPGGTVEFSPSSTDGFYPERSFVTVVPVPDPDYRIAGFSGDVSGDDGHVAFALMDRPRTIQASFEPLRMTIGSTSPVTLSVDNQSVAAPATYQWAAGSSHRVSAPTFVGTGMYAPVLAFDGWSDLRGQTHDILVTRDTFVTDLTAHYISTVRGVSVPSGGARQITSTGHGDAPRMAALTTTLQTGTRVPDMVQFVRGTVANQITTEFGLVPSLPRAWTSVVVEQDTRMSGTAGRVRVALFNPGTSEAIVGVLLRDGNGVAQAAKADALHVAAGAQVIAWLDEIIPVPDSFTSLLTIIGTEPLVTNVQIWRGNARPTFVRDPIILAPFSQGDSGVPLDPRVQVAFLTPDTSHRLSVINSGFSALHGSLAFRDSAGARVALDLGQGPVMDVPYDLAPGAFLTVPFATPAWANNADLTTLQILITPGVSQPAPALQLMEERQVGSSNGIPTLLPRAVPPSRAARSFRVPIDRSRRETGLVLTNTSAWPVTVTARVFDMDGAQVAQSTSTVSPGCQTVLSADAVAAQQGPGFRGQLRVDTDIPLHGVGYLHLENGRGEDIVAGYPATVGDAPIGTSAWAIDGDSWRSEWWFFNESGADSGSWLTFSGRDAQPVYFPLE